MPVEPTDTIDRLNAALDGRYAIERKLGEGGMATVFLADDLRHERRVALKVLKPELAAVVGGDRFLTEIKTTANLQHPHILPLYDSGEADGFLFYVMPYVEGESLRGRLDRDHQLPVDEAVRIATAVASALDYAHRHGVIHRDIKPANILLHDGEPIVADFGIALAIGALGGDRITETGLSLGTPHYMSPEQATGDQTVGPATDIYALGCVLYEMLIGDPPYTGSTPQIILGKIIAGEPESVRALRKSVPENVDATVRCALENLPADRFTSAELFSNALGNAGFRYGTEPRAVSARSVWNPLTVGLAAAVVLLLALLARELNRSTPAPTVRTYSLSLSGNDATAVEFGLGVALSADGSRLAYIGPWEGNQRVLWLKDRDEARSWRLPGVTHATQPFFSPDGERIAMTGFGAGTTRLALALVSLATGDIVVVADTGVWWAGGEWTDDGWLYVQGSDATIVRFSEVSGEREAVSELGEGEIEHLFPDVLPSGRGLLLTVWQASPDFENSAVAVLDFETGEHRVLGPGGMARYSESGHLVVVQTDGAVRAAPFDEKSLEVTGPFVRVLDGVAIGIAAGFNLALSSSGDLVYAAGATEGNPRELAWVERDGTARAFDPGWRAAFESVAISPRADRIAVTIGASNATTIWMKPLSEGPATRFTFTEGVNRRPVWVPESESVAFITDRAGNRDLYAKRADGSGSAEPILDLSDIVDQATWSPDGRWIAYRVGMTGSERDIFARRLGADSVTVPISTLPGVDEISPVISPDGRFLAYVSDESGTSEVWVRSFPDVKESRWQVSTGGGVEPVWSRDGDELFYRSPNHMIAVRVATDPGFAVATVDSLFFTHSYFRHNLHPSYDVAPDGRFLMIRNPPQVSELVVIENFGQLLIEKVGR